MECVYAACQDCQEHGRKVRFTCVPDMTHLCASQCTVDIIPDGCIAKETFARFLTGKWIPGYESSTDSRFVEPGHFFSIHRQLSKADRKQVAAEESIIRQRMVDELGRSKQERFEKRQGLPRDKHGKLPIDY
eukprot:6719144-Pyramimonas_sp.AAC.1